jgi:hypothetical protein
MAVIPFFMGSAGYSTKESAHVKRSFAVVVGDIQY